MPKQSKQLLRERYAARATLQQFWSATRPYKRWALLPLLFAPLGVTFDQLLPVLLTGLALGEIAKGTASFGPYLPILAALIASFVIKEIVWRLCIHYMVKLETAVMRDLIAKSYQVILAHAMRFHNDNFAGALVTKANRFSASFEPLYDTLVFDISTGLTVLTISAIVFGWRLPFLLAAFALITVLFICLMVWLVRKRIPLLIARAADETNRTAALADGITNVNAIKTFAAENYERKRFWKSADRLRISSEKAWRYQNIPIDLFAGSTTSFIQFTAIVFAIIGSRRGVIDVATAYFVVNIIGNLSRRVWEFSRVYRNVDKALADSREMTEIINQPIEITDPTEPIEFRVHEGSVEFDQVTFWYHEYEADRAIFNSLDLHIKPGEKIGLVGPSGGGKTTITKLLLRFMDIQSGQILIDGQDIAQARQADVRRAIAYVPQEPLLFHRSLLENIAYGNPDASLAEVTAAAKKAHAHEFIKTLPSGYDTLVGERGIKLSGGQRQRVAIARAMLKNAPILVLDEATSALDSESEKLIQEALWELMKGKTTIVIAHRLSTIQQMDRIVVLDEGSIVEQGVHKELLAQDGLYARLWTHQSGGFLEE